MTFSLVAGPPFFRIIKEQMFFLGFSDFLGGLTAFWIVWVVSGWFGWFRILARTLLLACMRVTETELLNTVLLLMRQLVVLSL